MTFVTADSSRPQLESLTKLLVSAFPGSTVFQHPDLLRVPNDALNNRVDAVFLEADLEGTGALNMVQMLHRQKPELSVFIVSQTDNLFEEAVKAGADGYFVLPDGEEQLLEAVRSTKNKEKIS